MADNSWIPGGDAFGSKPVYATSPSGTRYQMLQGSGSNNRYWMTPDGRQLQGNDALMAEAGGGGNTPGGVGTMSQWMATMGSGPPPTNPYEPGTMSTANRFAAGLGSAEGRLKSLLDNPDSINQSAAYKFRVGQGQEALQRTMGSKGLLNSGNRLMELTKYGQDMGSQEYEKQADRLSGLIGTYGQGYVADKNANTGAFAAQSGAWNTAEANRTKNNLGMAGIWADMNRAASGGSTVQRGASGMSKWPYGSAIGGGHSTGEVDWAAFNKEMKARQDEMDRY